MQAEGHRFDPGTLHRSVKRLRRLRSIPPAPAIVVNSPTMGDGKSPTVGVAVPKRTAQDDPMRIARRNRQESRTALAPSKVNTYREQQLRELLDVSRRPEVKLSVSQVEALLLWQETPGNDVRRLLATLESDQRLAVLRNAAHQPGPSAA